MTDSSTSVPSSDQTGPAAEPTLRPLLNQDDRSVSATWTVGGPDDDGWTPTTHLRVDHVRGVGYVATLMALPEKHHGPFVSTKVTPLAGSLVILRCPGRRFNRATITTVLEEALAAVRLRYQAHDQEVADYFDPTSGPFQSAH